VVRVRRLSEVGSDPDWSGAVVIVRTNLPISVLIVLLLIADLIRQDKIPGSLLLYDSDHYVIVVECFRCQLRIILCWGAEFRRFFG